MSDAKQWKFVFDVALKCTQNKNNKNKNIEQSIRTIYGNFDKSAKGNHSI